jgi:hypothetical protein
VNKIIKNPGINVEEKVNAIELTNATLKFAV